MSDSRKPAPHGPLYPSPSDPIARFYRAMYDVDRLQFEFNISTKAEQARLPSKRADRTRRFPGRPSPAANDRIVNSAGRSSRRERQVSERIRRTRKWGSVGALAGVALLVTAACSSSSSGTTPKSSSSTGTGKTVTKIAIAVPAKVSDYGWNQQGVNGARAVASATGANLSIISDIGYNNTAAQLSQLARNGA